MKEAIPYPRENTLSKKSRLIRVLTGRLIANVEFSFEYTFTRGLKSRFTLRSMTNLIVFSF